MNHIQVDKGKVKVKFTLELVSKVQRARWRWVVNATPRPLYLREGPGTLCTGGWVGPRAVLDG